MIFSSDVLVIGGGQAALRAAIEAREQGATVNIVSKGKIGLGGSSAISDGVHSAIFSQGDSAEAFYNDMLKGGKYLNNPILAKILAEECTDRVQELPEKFSVLIQYEREVATPGHSFPRRCYAGYGVGKGVTKPLMEYAQNIGITFFEKTWVVDLIKKDRIHGALGLVGNQWLQFSAGSIILATGGIGGLYANSDNPIDVSGEGIGMTWRHGATVQDMEFIQFYPYRLLEPRNIDLYTKLFGKGARMLNQHGERFMDGYPRKELETRDILSYEMFKQEKVYLDLSHTNSDEVEQMSPQLFKLLNRGYEGPFVMAPVEHYSIGGIVVDEYGRTNVPGLYACGECTAGVHGANRLGGGSITEALVFGARVGFAAAQESVPNNREIEDVDPSFYNPTHLTSTESKQQMHQLRQQMKEVMWQKVGIERTQDGLQEAVTKLESILRDVAEEKLTLRGIGKQVAEDMLRAAWLVSYSASLRKESRGAHRVLGYSSENEEWLGNIKINKDGWSFHGQERKTGTDL